MKINFKLRLKNKATLASLIGVVIAFIYQILGLFEIVPPISQDTVTQFVGLLLNILVAFGVIIDPTTAGTSDSKQALNYTEPKKEV